MVCLRTGIFVYLWLCFDLCVCFDIYVYERVYFHAPHFTMCMCMFDQMQVLEQSEGSESKLYRQLKAELREVKRVDCDKADREARKFHL